MILPNKKAQFIRDHLKNLMGQKILILGDIGLDEYVFGNVNRISPEAPVPIVDVQDISKKLGLSANVAANVKSLGGEPLLVSIIGNDKEGGGLKSILQQKEIDDNHLITDLQRPTTAKTRILCGQHHLVRVDYEKRHPLENAVADQVIDRLEQLIPQSDAVILQDYGKGLIDKNIAQKAIAIALKHSKNIMVDPHRSSSLEKYQGATLMTPNRDEAFELVRQIPDCSSQPEVEEVGRALMKKIQSPKMVVTLGAQGMRIFEEDHSLEIPTFARKVFDVTGAGDTVISAFALGISGGWTMEQSAYLANIAAGIVVGHVGAMTCTPALVDEELKNLATQ